MPSSQPLGSKESSLFKQVIKFYEAKQYKKGLKACEQIFRKVPKHGETMAMKGLIIAGMGQTEEAFAIVKESVRVDMKSHICWHAYGLLWRAEKNYEEAAKAYKMALRFEPDSPQIIRDLNLLQIQTRDYAGYAETRNKIMLARPTLRQNWTALAIAYHLAGLYVEAEKVLTKYEETLKDKPAKWDIEHWEACLYKNRIIAESGDTERALEHLESIAKGCLDKASILGHRAEYLLKLGRTEEATEAYRALLRRNQENRAHYAGLEKCLGFTGDDRKKAKSLYEEYAKEYPRSDAPKRIPLDFLDGEDFRQAADSYLTEKLKKGVPSTFASVRALYVDPAKQQTILDLVSGYHAAQEKESSESTSHSSTATRFRLWTLYFLAQHYDHYRTRDFDKALHYLNKAIEVEPKAVELLMTVARVHKHAGDLKMAMEKIDEARQLDKSDRYINTKTAKYQLRNNQNETALKTMSLFTRNEANGGPLGDLLEMQCVWYITEDAESYLRQNNLGLALKRFNSLWKIFDDWTEDQFDFHSFSLRKGQIRAYVDMLRWEDTLRSHPFFVRGALGAIKAYLRLADNPTISTNGVDATTAKMTGGERKKAAKKAKKEEQKAQERAAAAAQKQKEDKNKNAQVGEEKVQKVDPDPKGEELLKTKAPLEGANRWLSPLLELAPERIEVQIAGFEVHFRRKKWLLALKCLLKARRLMADDPRTHEILVRMRKTVNDLPADVDLSPESKEVLNEELDKALPRDTDLAAYNDAYLSAHPNSSTHLRHVLLARRFLNPSSDITTPLTEDLRSESITLNEALEGLQVLKELNEDIAAYRQEATKRWTKANAFAA